VVDGLSFDSIDEVVTRWLERDFEKKEVWEVVKTTNDDKASSPNGYTMAFTQACWVVLKEDIMKVFCQVHASGKFKRDLNLNAPFLALISKILGAVNSKDFHPINQVGSIYKMIAKTLACKIKMMLEKIISKS
jgi:hypothetical protein